MTDTLISEGAVGTDRLLVVSSDCHAGPKMAAFRPYMAGRHRAAFDDYTALVEAYDRRQAEAFAAAGAAMSESMQKFASRDEVEGLWDPEARRRDLDLDGLAAEVIYPQGAVPFHSYPPNVSLLPALTFSADDDQGAAGVRAYNQWLAEFCSQHPDRHAGIAVVPIRDVAAAVREVEWAAANGLRGVSLPPIADDHPTYNDRVYDPLWAACVAAQMPLNAHGVNSRFYGYGPDAVALLLAECDFFSRRSLWYLMFGGVFDRYPELQIVVAEQRAGWVMPMLNDLNSIYRTPTSGIAASIKASPTEYFARNCWIGASFMSRAEADERHAIGVDRIMWGSDYPHQEGTWPYTGESLRRTFEGVPLPELRQMLGENAVRCYHLDHDRLRAVAERIGPAVTSVQAPPGELPEFARFTWAFRDGNAWF